MIDFRSDTMTRPSPGMLQAMFAAEVGDDDWREDPTVNRLEEMAAKFLGQEAALFVPSGTMANHVALKCWTQPADELIIERRSHVYNMECAGAAALWGVSSWTVDAPDGILSPEDVARAIRPRRMLSPVTRLVVLENTHNTAGGTCYSVERVRELREVTHKYDLKLHMDGARLANAAVATGVSVAEYGKLCDSVTQCLSKGLGCPAGSMVAGSREFISRARRIRKMLGGVMRQTGYLAAAGIYALQHNIARLAEDHLNMKSFVQGIAEIPGIEAHPERVVTNIAFFKFRDGETRAREVMQALQGDGIMLGIPMGDTVRAVTHLDVSAEDIDCAVQTLRRRMAS